MGTYKIKQQQINVDILCHVDAKGQKVFNGDI